MPPNMVYFRGLKIRDYVRRAEMNFDWSILLELMAEFQVWTILALIGLDLILGVAAAIKHKEFDWKKLGQFYRSNILPYVLGYVGSALVFRFAGQYIGEWLSDSIVSVTFGAIAVNLVSSIVANVKKLGLEYPPQ